MTLVDRKTRFLVARKLDDYRAETLKKSIARGAFYGKNTNLFKREFHLAAWVGVRVPYRGFDG